MKIGFIGTGLMGGRMAANLIDNGYELIVWNRTKSKTDKLVEKGAEWGGTPANTASESDMLITMLSEPKVVVKMAIGDDGFLDALRPGKLWMDCSTVDPGTSKMILRQAEKRDIHFIDSPVAGSTGPAENGELLFLLGGKEEDIKKVRPLIDVMGRGLVHGGGNGMGASLKMVINSMLGMSMAAFAEAMHLGESLGLSKETLLDTLVDGPVVAPFIKFKRDKIEKEEFPVEFPLKWMQKDLHLAAKSGWEKDIALPSVNAVKEAFAMAKQKGYADEDFSAIYGFLRKGQ